MSWSVNFEAEKASCWLIFVNTIGSKQRYRWISGPWFVRYDFPNSKTSLKPWFFLSEFELKRTESCRWKNRISATRSLFSVQKQKKQERFPKNWNRCMVFWCLLPIVGTASKTWNEVWPNWQPRQTDANDEARKRGKTLFWDLITFLLDLDTFNGPYYNSFGLATLLLDLHTLLLDLILPSCSTWPFPKPYPFRIDSTVSVQPRLHRNFSDSRALELR